VGGIARQGQSASVDALSGDFNQAQVGGEQYDRQVTTSGGLGGGGSSETQGSLNVAANNSGNWLTGAQSLDESTSDRYTLLVGFDNASNDPPGAVPGALAFLPQGGPYSVGPASIGSGTGAAQTGGGTATGAAAARAL